MNINLDKLKYFVEAAKLEHINKAAKKVNISPSVISESIKSLEKELNLTLFKRIKNRIYLTEDGHKTLNKALKTLKSVELLYLNDNQTIEGDFKIGISQSLFKSNLIPIKKITNLINHNPNLKISINTSDTGQIIDLVIRGVLDAAVVYSPIKHENIIEEKIHETQFKIALKKKHPIFSLSKNEQIKMLSKLPAIGFQASVGHNFCQYHPIFDKFGIIPNYKFFYDNDQIAIELVKKSNAWIFISDKIIEQNKSIKALELGTEWNVPMGISLIRNRTKLKHQAIDVLTHKDMTLRHRSL